MLTAAMVVTMVSSAASARGVTFYGGDSVQVRGTGGWGLNVRSGPSTGYQAVSELSDGQVVRVVAGPVSNNGYGWYKVAGSSGSIGWSAGPWLYRVSSGGGKATNSQTTTLAYRQPAQNASNNTTSGVTGESHSVLATGYNGAEFNSTGVMANGNRVHWGAVAVDPRYIPLGTKMYVSGFGNQVFVAEDTGSAIKGWRLDIWFPSLAQARNHGGQTRTITLIR